MENNNIIDVDNLGSKLDLSFFTNEIEELQFRLNILKNAYNIFNDSVQPLIKKSQLENIKFAPLNIDAFYKTACMDGFFPDIVFSGDDKEYNYFIVVKMNYDDCDEEDFDEEEEDTFSLCSGEEDLNIIEPDSVFGYLIKSKKGSQDSMLSTFNFEERKWKEIDTCDLLSLTPSQFEMIKDAGTSCSGKAQLFLLYYHSSGKLVRDEEFNKFYEKNKNLVELYDRLPNNIELHLMNDLSVCLTTSLDCTGLAVMYEDGLYKIKGCVIGNMLFDAFSVDNIEEAISVIKNMLGYVTQDNIPIPLSKSAFALLDNTGNCVSMVKNKRKEMKLTKAEEKKLNKFLDDLSEICATIMEDDENE